MSSYIQVIVGLMLLVTAFLVGRHINDKPIIVTNQQLSKETPIQLQVGTEASNTNEDPGAPMESHKRLSDEPEQSGQRSLRERILGQRQVSKSRVETSTQSGDTVKPFSLSDNDIVMPDFSAYENSPLPPIVENLPKSDQHTQPEKIDNNDSNIPSRDLGEVAERRLSFKPLHEKAEIVEQQSSVSRGSLRVVKKPTANHLGPVRHRESRITTESEEFVDYTTVFGDTLHGLSTRFFGKPDYYLDIYLANKDLFENPSKVPVNTKLKIPVMAELTDQVPEK